MAHTSIRFGLGRFTTDAEVDYAVEVCERHVHRLREMSPLWEMVQVRPSSRTPLHLPPALLSPSLTVWGECALRRGLTSRAFSGRDTDFGGHDGAHRIIRGGRGLAAGARRPSLPWRRAIGAERSRVCVRGMSGVAHVPRTLNCML